MKRAIKFLLLACAVTGLAAACTPPATGGGGAVDTTAPQILSVDVVPLEVAPGQQFKVQVLASDAVGVTAVTVVVRANSLPVTWCGGPAVLTSGTAQTGVWERTCTAPAVVNAGTYQVNTLALDARNNNTVIGDGPPNATSGHFTVSGATSDHDAPVVQSVTVTPGTATGGSTLTISAHVVDPSGVKAVGFVARRAGFTPGFCITGALLVSGTPQDGVWSRTCTVPVGTLATSYWINTTSSDLLDNIGVLNDPPTGPTSGSFTITG